MRPKASHLEPHRPWISCPCSCHRGRGAMTASPRQRSRRSAAFGKAACRSITRDFHRDFRSATAAVASSLFCSVSRKGRRPQRPGNQCALAHVTGCFPRRLTLANHRLPLALPQSSGKVRKSHVSLQPTLGHFVAAINTKSALVCAEPVDVETLLWRREENLDSICRPRNQILPFLKDRFRAASLTETQSAKN